mmetsp:Transcript_14102/g.27020  ORF Transcript_14102/g.27020 Transcript_14102/m.27020 type:complete len:352 (-) Transcript_14102:596-1651(-)
MHPSIETGFTTSCRHRLNVWISESHRSTRHLSRLDLAPSCRNFAKDHREGRIEANHLHVSHNIFFEGLEETSRSRYVFGVRHDANVGFKILRGELSHTTWRPRRDECITKLLDDTRRANKVITDLFFPCNNGAVPLRGSGPSNEMEETLEGQNQTGLSQFLVNIPVVQYLADKRINNGVDYSNLVIKNFHLNFFQVVELTHSFDHHGSLSSTIGGVTRSASDTQLALCLRQVAKFGLAPDVRNDVLLKIEKALAIVFQKRPPAAPFTIHGTRLETTLGPHLALLGTLLGSFLGTQRAVNWFIASSVTVGPAIDRAPVLVSQLVETIFKREIICQLSYNMTHCNGVVVIFSS